MATVKQWAMGIGSMRYPVNACKKNLQHPVGIGG